jgi:hypothetical protein
MTAPKRFLFMTAILAMAVITATAQDAKREAQLRTVHGIVQDKSENLVSESVVFLKNTRTNVVRSSYTDSTGKYRFSGLDPNADYEVFAEKDGAKSAVHTITSFDSRKDLTLNLKIEKKKD